MEERIIIDHLKERKNKRSLTIEELASDLNIEGRGLKELNVQINNMIATGQVVKSKKVGFHYQRI